MASRKPTVKNRADLANKLAKLTVNKDEAPVSVFRKALKRLVQLEAAGIVKARKSALMMLRQEANVIAAKVIAKRKKKAAK
jgi:hypothetical protein